MSAKAEHIMIIDREQYAREELAKHLRSKGYYVTGCDDLGSALANLSTSPPDVIFADLGPAAIYDLAHQEQVGDLSIPVIAFGQATTADEVVAALRAGASDFVIKPLADKSAVDDVLTKLFERLRVARLNEVYRHELESKNLNLREGISELRADQTAGRKVQMKMLPEGERTIGDITLAHLIKPSLFLSGDFLDYLRLDDHLSLVYIADVSGHGASSAFVTVLLKNLTNRLQRNLRRGSSDDIMSPARFLQRVNKELQDTRLGKHVTMFVGLVDDQARTLTYSVGAHFPMPILTSPEGTDYLEGSGLPIGLFENPEWETYTKALPQGFRLILFSDGILEVINAKSLDQKEKRLLELVDSGRHTIDKLSESLQLEQISELPDDIAIVTVTDRLATDDE